FDNADEGYQIGAGPDANAFAGNLADVRVFAGALSAGQVADVYGGRLVTAEDTPVTIYTDRILANDKDTDGDVLTVLTFDAVSAAGGNVTLNANHTFTFSPAADFNGTDSFSYSASDGYGGTS